MLARAAFLTSLVYRAPTPLSRVGSTASLAMKASGVRNPNNLPVKTCVVCNRDFTWRKKWEDCWDEVTTCSKRCNGERKKANRIASRAAAANGDDTATDATGCMSDSSSDEQVVDDDKAARKAAKKAAKALRRAKREGDYAGGQKACEMCDRRVDLLIRCQIASGDSWKLVCGRCWKTPAVAGGVVDGDGSNPHYRYGGVWKNLHRATA